MTDERGPRNRQGKRQKKTPPSITLSHGQIVRARDDTFSTTVSAYTDGYWEGGLPTEAQLFVDDQPANMLPIYNRTATFPLTGLTPESHHRIAVRVRENYQEMLLVVQALPKPKRPEEEALELERIGLEREKVALERHDLTKPAAPKLPAKLIVDPYRVKNKIHLSIRVVDEEGIGVKGAKLTIHDSKKGTKTQYCDEDGEHEHPFRLKASEEREVSICVSGHGDKAFRRTFRGRNY